MDTNDLFGNNNSDDSFNLTHDDYNTSGGLKLEVVDELKDKLASTSNLSIKDAFGNDITSNWDKEITNEFNTNTNNVIDSIKNIFDF